MVIGSLIVEILWSCLSSYFARPRDQSVYVLAALKVSHHPTKFGGNKHCGSGDIKISVCHVILQDHVMKEPCDFASPAKQVTIMLSLATIATLVVGL